MIFNGIKAPGKEYTLEFWFLSYSYNDNSLQFDSHELVWEGLLKIQFFNSNNNINIKCFPNYNSTPPSASAQSITDYTQNQYFVWNYVQCSVSLITKKYYLNLLQEASVIQSNSNLNLDSLTTLTIKSSDNSKTNYGFLFLKEIRMWSLYNLRVISTKCVYDNPTNTYSLLNYIQINQNYMNSISEIITGISANLQRRTDFIGYNIIDINNSHNVVPPLNLNICNIENLILGPYIKSLFLSVGYKSTTSFVFECIVSSSLNTTKFQYKYYYNIANSIRNQTLMRNYSDSYEINYVFNEQNYDYNATTLDLNVFCDVINNVNNETSTALTKVKICVI